MPRSRANTVLSFISQWGSQSPSHSRSPSDSKPADKPNTLKRASDVPRPATPPVDKPIENLPETTVSPTPTPRPRKSSHTGSRPSSMVQTFQPPMMDVARDTAPELLPIFTFLNAHSDKLYQEGYFLKLHDLDPRGKPSHDRAWQECFAQLVGTVLSIWDAAELDSAGGEREVLPNFINIADASLKMIESLPMNGATGQALQNVLSLSTAGNNRYLLHFSSYASMTQWVAGIRLAIFENMTLQEAYTGSLIAGRGRSLNNIRQIMERNRVKYEDWARVRFGAGTPWRKCWFVLTPPDEKEYQKAQKSLNKKKSPYEKAPVLKGDLKFYDSKRITKRTKPIATITDAFSAYAIYPASKPLVEQSTLVKVEGKITIHSESESSTDGTIFVMPEIHPAVTGFEMMLRFLFPCWDTFALYGRPNRLIADVRDARGLMFAMPKDRKYGYLENLDVSKLVHEGASETWTERDWRREMKKLTEQRMLAFSENKERGIEHGLGHRPSASRTSLPASRKGGLRFDDSPPGTATPVKAASSINLAGSAGQRPGHDNPYKHHRKSASEVLGFSFKKDMFSNIRGRSPDHDSPPPPPPHGDTNSGHYDPLERFETGSESSGRGSGDKTPDRAVPPEVRNLTKDSPPLQPVASPPAMAHAPSQKPKTRPPIQTARSGPDTATLSQLQEMNGLVAAASSSPQLNSPTQDSYRNGPHGYAGQHHGGQGWDNHGGNLSAPHNQQYPHHRAGRGQAPRLAPIPASPFVDQNQSPAGASPNSYFPGGAQPPFAPGPGGRPAVARKPVGSPASQSPNGHPDQRSHGQMGPPPNSPPRQRGDGYGPPMGHPNGPQMRGPPPNGQFRGPPPMMNGQGQRMPMGVGAGPYAPVQHMQQQQYGDPRGMHRQGPTSSPGQERPLNHSRSAQVLGDRNGYAQRPIQGDLPLGAPRPPPHVQNGAPQGAPASRNGPPAHDIDRFSSPPAPSAKEQLYGGQVLPIETVMAMKKRDMRMYGAQYVQSMERMTGVSGFRSQSPKPNAAPTNQAQPSGAQWI